MKNFSKFLALPLTGLTLSAFLTTQASAIEGGNKESTPWVSLINLKGSSGEIGTCSASQLDQKTFLTAKHCLSASDHPSIKGIDLDLKSVKVMHGDAVTVKLAKPKPLNSYAKLSISKPVEYENLYVHGFGIGGLNQKVARMVFKGKFAPDVQGQQGFVLESSTGTPTPGDSGGPVATGNNVLGVISGATPSGEIVASPLG